MRRFSRRRLMSKAGNAAVAAFVAACAAPALANANTTPPESLHDLSSTVNRPPLLARLEPSLPIPDVALETKIGQMLLVGFAGKYVNDSNSIIQEIRAKRVGGVVLFGHNVASPDQLLSLTNTLQSAANIPLLISVDQEGGAVSRLRNFPGLTLNYSAQELGTIDDLAITRQQGDMTAVALSAAGINVNLAPVVDLNLNPANPIIGRYKRSFSADPAIVVRHANEVIQAHHDHRIINMIKHFPGHGSSTGDTHAGFVDVTESWREIELEPFKALIETGQVDAVMTAHIFNANLDPELPATLSRHIIEGTLRERFGFDGVICTDDMQMRAISANYEPEDAIYRAISAGVDIISVSNNIAGVRALSASRAFDIILDLVQNGLISPERIDQSFQRIMRMKSRLTYG